MSVIYFHVYFDKQVHINLEKKNISKQKTLKTLILLNQMCTEKQTCTAALRYTIYFFLENKILNFIFTSKNYKRSSSGPTFTYSMILNSNLGKSVHIHDMFNML